ASSASATSCGRVSRSPAPAITSPSTATCTPVETLPAPSLVTRISTLWPPDFLVMQSPCKYLKPRPERIFLVNQPQGSTPGEAEPCLTIKYVRNRTSD